MGLVEPEVVVVDPPKVEPISPNLMFENVTDALGEFFSMSVGLPEVVAQGPRLIPGTEESLSVG